MLALVIALAAASPQEHTLSLAEIPTRIVGAPGHLYLYSLLGVTDVQWDGSQLIGANLPTQGDRLYSFSFSYVPRPLPGAPMLIANVEINGEIRCYDVLGDILDPIPGLQCGAFRTTDIDGDSFDDFHPVGYDAHPEDVATLSGSGTYTSRALDLPLAAWSFPFPDLDLDGYADVVYVDFTYDDRLNPGSSSDCFGFPNEDGCLEARDSTTRVYTGSPEGYLDVPTVELHHERVLHRDALQPIQYDADPELELIGIAVTESPAFDWNDALVLLDLTPPASLQVLAEGLGAWDQPEAILVIDDEDFDGIDDIVIVLDRGLYLHSSANPELPLWEWSGSRIRDAIAHDLDQDGLRDLVVLHDHTVHVFFAPFTYELPEDTGHTADTAASTPTGDTADTAEPTPTDTAHTGPATDTADDDTAAASSTGPVCGCQALTTAPHRTTPTHLLRRRRP